MKAIIFIENFDTMDQQTQMRFGRELNGLMQKYGLFAKSVEAGHEHDIRK